MKWGDHDPEALAARDEALRGKPFLSAMVEESAIVHTFCGQIGCLLTEPHTRADHERAELEEAEALNVAAAGVQEWHDGWGGEGDTSVSAAAAALQALREAGYTIRRTT